MKKEVNYLTTIKKDFSRMLKETMDLDVVGMNIKHKAEMGVTDVIKFTVQLETGTHFIYAHVNRQDKKTIKISTDISETFLQELSTKLMHKKSDIIVDAFKSNFLNFAKKYSLLKKSDFMNEPFLKSDFGYIRDYSSHAYFFATKTYSNHFINNKLYNIRQSLITISTKMMFYYDDNGFVAYPFMRIQFGSIKHDVHLYNAYNMQKDLNGFISKALLDILPIVQVLFQKVFDIDNEAFNTMSQESFEDHLSIIAMKHI